MIRKLQTMSRMPWRVQFDVLEAAVLLTFAYIGVKFFFPRIARTVTRPAQSAASSPPSDVRDAMRRSISIAARNLPWKCVCLPRAIAGKWFLARRGYGSNLKLGVGLDQGSFSAHAWLEAGEVILIGARGAENLSVLL